MPTGRARSYLDAVGVVACEVLLLGFFLESGPLLGTVDFSHLATWLRTSSPEGALTALLRLLGTAVSAWLLGSTVLYAAAALTRKRGLLRGLHLFTLPVLRQRAGQRPRLLRWWPHRSGAIRHWLRRLRTPVPRPSSNH